MTRTRLLLQAVITCVAYALGANACAIQRGESLRVTADSIANLRLDHPLGELRKRSPTAADTTVQSFGSSWPGVAFHYPELIVAAAQHRDTLDPALPADSWTLTGCGARLPHDVPVCANWQELTRAFGDSGRGHTRFGPAVVNLCALPGFQFELDVSARTVGALETAPDLSRVPATARVQKVTISRVPADCH